MTISYAGIPIGYHTDELISFIESHIDPNDVFSFAARTFPGARLAGLPFRQGQTPPPVRINRLYWPVGASRFAVFYGLVDAVQLAAIRAAVYPTVSVLFSGTAQGGTLNTIILDATAPGTDDEYEGAEITLTAGTGAGQIRRFINYDEATFTAIVEEPWITPPDATSVFTITSGLYRAAPLILSDGLNTVATDMWLLPPRPLQTLTDIPLHLLVLVDDRFFHWFRSSALLVTGGTTTWEELLDQIASALGIALTGDTVDAAYLLPGDGFSLVDEPLPLILDAVCASVGQRVVKQLDGTYYRWSAVNSRDQTELNVALLLAPTAGLDGSAGGAFSIGTSVPLIDDVTVLPESVEVIYKVSDSGVDAGVIAYSVTLASLLLPDFLTVVGFPGVKTFHSSAVALGTGTPTNDAELMALTEQIAIDFYRWQCGRLDLRLIGYPMWTLTGLDDCALYDHQADCATRIARGPWFDHLEELLVWTGPQPGTGTTLAVGEVDLSPYIDPASVVLFDQADGFVVTNPAPGVAQVNFTGGGGGECWPAYFNTLDTDQNDYDPSPLMWYQLTRNNSPTNVNITGLLARGNGCPLLITHAGATLGSGFSTSTITLKCSSTASTAFNRILNQDGLAVDVLLTSGSSVLLRYDTQIGRWRILRFPYSLNGLTAAQQFLTVVNQPRTFGATSAAPALSLVDAVATHTLTIFEAQGDAAGYVSGSRQYWGGTKYLADNTVVGSHTFNPAVLLGDNLGGFSPTDRNSYGPNCGIFMTGTYDPFGITTTSTQLQAGNGGPFGTHPIFTGLVRVDSNGGFLFAKSPVGLVATAIMGAGGSINFGVTGTNAITGLSFTAGWCTGLGANIAPPPGTGTAGAPLAPTVKTPGSFMVAAQRGASDFPATGTQQELVLQPPGYAFTGYVVEIIEPFTQTLPGSITVDIGTAGSPTAYINGGNLAQARGSFIASTPSVIGSGLASLIAPTSIKVRVNYVPGTLVTGAFKVHLKYEYVADVGLAAPSTIGPHVTLPPDEDEDGGFAIIMGGTPQPHGFIGQ